jgi:hypothetical protein
MNRDPPGGPFNMGEDLQVRGYIESDDQDLSRLMDEVFGRNWDEGVFEWKYRRNPAGRALSAVAEREGKLIGQLGAIPVRFFVDGRELVGTQEVDGCLDKKHGKFDTFFHLVRLRRKMNDENEIGFSYFFSVDISSKIAQKALKGSMRVCATPILVKVLGVEPLLRDRLRPKWISRLLAPIVDRALRLAYPTRGPIPKGVRMKRVERFDERFDDLWNRIKGDYPIMIVRDSAYLNWRYVDVPHRDYTVFCLENEETTEILGFIVVGEEQRAYRVGHILELVTPRTGQEEVVRALVRGALQEFMKRKIPLVYCLMLPHCHAFQVLRRAGFRKREKEGMDLIFGISEPKAPVIAPELAGNEENWYVCTGDSDFY